MSKPKLASTSELQIKHAADVLDHVKAKGPSEVVIWYCVPGADGEVGVEISRGTSRTKAVGALTAAAMDVWQS